MNPKAIIRTLESTYFDSASRTLIEQPGCENPPECQPISATFFSDLSAIPPSSSTRNHSFDYHLFPILNLFELILSRFWTSCCFFFFVNNFYKIVKWKKWTFALVESRHSPTTQMVPLVSYFLRWFNLQYQRQIIIRDINAVCPMTIYAEWENRILGTVFVKILSVQHSKTNKSNWTNLNNC